MCGTWRVVGLAVVASLACQAPAMATLDLQQAERELAGLSQFEIVVPASVGLASAAGSVTGSTIGSDLGAVAVTGGDINGDGTGDLVASAGSGGWVVGGPIALDENLATREPAFTFSSTVTGGGAFNSNAEVGGIDTGDVNGDGKGDVLFGKPNEDTESADAGRVYVFFGKGAATDVVGDPAGFSGGFVIQGGGLDRAGAGVAALPDLNGDRRQEIVVGAPGGNRAVVVFGKDDGATVDLDRLGGAGFEIASDPQLPTPGGMYVEVGDSVAHAGDVNRDGLPDILIGAPSTGLDAGAAIVVFGKATTTPVDLDSLGAGGYAMNAERTGGEVGSAVGNAGDVNGDGRPDQIIGGPHAGAALEGVVYVVFGKSSSTTVRLENLGPLGGGGFIIEGTDPIDETGAAVAGGRDLNDDGMSDLLIGAPERNIEGRAGTPRAYVVYGKATKGRIDLGELTERQGYAITTTKTASRAGAAVALTGQLAGESGGSDVVVSEPFEGSGTVWILDHGTTPEAVINDARFGVPSLGSRVSASAGRGPAGALTFRLSRPARVTVRLRRMTHGRRVGSANAHRCAVSRRRPARRARCTRLVRARTVIRAFRQPGRQRITFDRRSLRPGFYVLDLVAEDLAGRMHGPGRAIVRLP